MTATTVTFERSSPLLPEEELYSREVRAILVQPLCDVRGLLDVDPVRLLRPAFPIARKQKGHDFIRSFGGVADPVDADRSHWREEFPWPGDDCPCIASHGLRFVGSLAAKRLGPSKMLVRCTGRHLYSDGEVTTRVETGFKLQTTFGLPASTVQLPDTMKDLGLLDVKVPTGRSSYWEGPLLGAGPHLAGHLRQSSTRRIPSSAAPNAQGWWITSGRPVLLVMYRDWTGPDPIVGFGPPDTSGQGFRMVGSRLQAGSHAPNVWFVSWRSPSAPKNVGANVQHLIRLHCLRESFRCVLRLVLEGQLKPRIGDDPLQAFLLRASRLLSSSQSHGVDTRGAIAVAYEADRMFSQQEQASLEAALAIARPQVLKRMKDALTVDNDATRGTDAHSSHSAAGNVFNIGKLTMGDFSDNRIKARDIKGSQVGRDLRASKSFNRSLQSEGLPPELKQLLVDMEQAATKAAKELPSETAKSLRSDMDGFAAEVTRENRRVDLIKAFGTTISQAAAASATYGPGLVETVRNILRACGVPA